MPTQTAPQPESDPKRFQCRHIHANGRRCGSPALRHEHFCYYHHATRRPAPQPNAPRYPDAAQHPFALPTVEDRSSIQLALNFVLSRIASNDLDPKRAGLLLYGLQIAAIALPREPRPAPAASACQYGHPCVPDTDANPNSPNEIPADFALDPDLGPLAPIAELHPPAPKDRPVSSIERILRDMARDGIFCTRCNPGALPEPTPPANPEAAAPPNPSPTPEDPPPFDLSTLPTIQAVADPAYPVPPKARVPHPSQPHRDGWGRKPLTHHSSSSNKTARHQTKQPGCPIHRSLTAMGGT